MIVNPAAAQRLYLSETAYREICTALRAAGYTTRLERADGLLDLSGLAIARREQTAVPATVSPASLARNNCEFQVQILLRKIRSATDSETRQRRVNEHLVRLSRENLEQLWLAREAYHLEDPGNYIGTGLRQLLPS